MSTPLVGRDLRLFVLQQSSGVATPGAEYPSAGDAVVPRASGGYSDTPSQSWEALSQEATGYAYPVHVLEQARGGEVAVEIDAYLSGTSGTAPDWDHILTMFASLDDSGGESTTYSGTQSNSGNTSTISVTSATGFVVGGAVSVVVGTSVYLSRITGVAGSDITVTPRLPTLVNGVAVKTIRIYSLRSDLTDAEALTVFAAWARLQRRVVGWVPNALTFSGAPNQIPTLSARGACYRIDELTVAELDGNINDSVTSLDVAYAASMPSIPDTDSEVYWQIDSEIIKQSAVSADGLTWTIARAQLGSSAAAHTSGAALTPYRPTTTTSFAAPSGYCGRTGMIDDVTVRVHQTSLEIQSGVEALPQAFGDCSNMPGFYQGSGGSAVLGLTILLDDNGQTAIQSAQRRESVSLFSQFGSIDGAAMAVLLPTARLVEPPVASADLLTAELSATGFQTSTLAPAYIMIG